MKSCDIPSLNLKSTKYVESIYTIDIQETEFMVASPHVFQPQLDEQTEGHHQHHRLLQHGGPFVISDSVAV